LPDVQLVLAMTVNPGFGGQKMIPAMLEKVARLRAMLQEIGSQAWLQVDGGVNLENVGMLKAQGANMLVAGTVVFRAPNAAQTIAQLRTRA
ncbi:MAG: ribulose-phosphate 3-epimerase, partial [Clostridia bacterium]